MARVLTISGGSAPIGNQVSASLAVLNIPTGVATYSLAGDNGSMIIESIARPEIPAAFLIQFRPPSTDLKTPLESEPR